MYLAAGYRITRWVPRPSYTSPAMPERLVSLSRCIAPRLPDTWAIEWTGDTPEERERLAAAFGIGPAGLPAVLRWVTARFESEIGWPDVCFTLDTARELAAFAGSDDVLLLGIGVDERYVSGLVDAEEPFKPGIRDALLRRTPLAPGGDALGHELVAANCGLSCSWLCNRLEAEVPAALGLRPNPHGLVDDPAAAAAAAEHIGRPGTGAEPGLWLPWLLVRYPL
jgi:hypothetical protein